MLTWFLQLHPGSLNHQSLTHPAPGLTDPGLEWREPGDTPSAQLLQTSLTQSCVTQSHTLRYSLQMVWPTDDQFRIANIERTSLADVSTVHLLPKAYLLAVHVSCREVCQSIHVHTQLCQCCLLCVCTKTAFAPATHVYEQAYNLTCPCVCLSVCLSVRSSVCLSV
jgi:hypothetical protein